MTLTASWRLSCYGIGAVLSHCYPDDTERPIVFASRMLLPSEYNYAQIGTLTGIYMQKFPQYFYGCQCTFTTNHCPLTKIFGDKRGIPPVAATKLQRWT